MRLLRQLGWILLFSSFVLAADNDRPALTIYNQNFATVRQIVVLDLKSGTTSVRFSDATAQVEPDSVILRDFGDKRALQVLEQNYRNDPVSQGRMLSLYEGKTIEFLLADGKTVSGKVVRSGYVPGAEQLQQPIVEVDGRLRFSLPGEPLFPALADDTILRPTFYWLIRTDQPGRSDAELSYITGGLKWEADYNLVAPENGDVLDVVGWITMSNGSGKTFENADIKLMAGDVHKLPPPQQETPYCPTCSVVTVSAEVARVKEKAFDEFHLYTLPLPTTLHDAETKQVEFLRASGVRSKRSYVYDGADIGDDWEYQESQSDRGYGTKSKGKVAIYREFMNSKANHLGMPLPHGRIRFYRRDDDGRLEFTGENTIDHTPKDERVRIYTGDAFDLVGERKQTDFKTWTREAARKGGSETIDNTDETFEIKLRNHKKSAVEVKVVEHLYRSATWKIAESSQAFKKTDSRTIEFMVTVPPDGEKTVTYRVHYEW